jgi:eukaryotic-like serine/threonine-protein kinase
MWLSDSVVDRVSESSEEPDLSGTRYRLSGKLGRGGMGIVYAAHDVELDRDVALKVSSAVAAAPEQLAQRLRQEARILAKLEHPGIVPIHDAGVLPDGRVYYTMKLVRGQRLDAWARHQADLQTTLRLFGRICEAVAFAHAKGILHRDLKPQNIMVGEFGEALVMDWGAALHGGGSSEGAVIGTPGYMAPEQARGATVDSRADVFSLGAILKFLLDLRPAEVKKPITAICDMAMSADPAYRYRSAIVLAKEVDQFLDGAPVSAYQEGLIERVTRFASRNRVVLSLLAAYLVVRAALILLSTEK